jgi:hypothetical protein
VRAAKGVVLVALVCLVVSPAWAARQPSRQSPRRAELNLLRSPRMLGRWHTSFLDPRTQLLRPNIVVRCVGASTAVEGRFHTLSCSITLAPWRVRLRYLALGRYGFMAKRVRLTSASG